MFHSAQEDIHESSGGNRESCGGEQWKSGDRRGGTPAHGWGEASPSEGRLAFDLTLFYQDWRFRVDDYINHFWSEITDKPRQAVTMKL